MAKKYLLKLKNTASPHLFIDDIKKMIENDKVLYPQTRQMLVLLKRFNRSYLQLALERELIISEKLEMNIERALSPQLTIYQKFEWNEDDKKSFSKSREEFYLKILQFYDRLGYHIEEQFIDDDFVKRVSNDIDIAKAEHKKKVEKAQKEQEKKDL